MRVIQDSEDEDDLEILDAEVAVPECEAPPNHHISSNASSKPGEKGTGSTESLKRAIVAAHRAQFRDASSDHRHHSNLSDAPPVGDQGARSIDQEAPQSSISLPGHANKRRRTSLDDAVALSSARDISTTTYDKRQTGQAEYNANTHLGPTLERPWELQGTMREDWEHHEPMGLFPQTVSSTIPNATATQQQLLAEVLAPGFLGIDPVPDEPHYQPAKSSVPWSDYLKSSSRDSQAPAPSAEHLSPLSQNNACDSAARLSESSLLNEVTAEPSAPVDALPLAPIDEQVSHDVSTHSKLQLPCDLVYTVASPPSQDKQKLSSILNSEDDLMVIGLPMEQYKPRPSRSRSLKVSSEEPIDYSRRPEKAAKKTRRTRTSGEVESASTATTPEKVRQICDMGFTPLSTRKALRQHNGDVTHTVNWLITNGVTAGEELAPPEASKPKNKKTSERGESEQDPSIESSHNKSTEVVMEKPNALVDRGHAAISDKISRPTSTTMATKSPTVVKVVIPREKKPTALSKHMEQQATAPALPQHASKDASGNTERHQEVIQQSNHQNEQAVAAEQPPKGKKRGRGRPRKETKAIESIEEEPSENKTQKPDELMINEEVLPEEKTYEPEKSLVTNGILDGHHINIAEDAGPGLTATQTAPETLPPEKKVNQTADASPSIGKGRTPYRVGLSKRARIAPLLRIVKK